MNPTRGVVVIADDEEAARRSLGQILTEDGYGVTLAGDGEEALRLVAQESPDILLTDLKMPRLDGEELLVRVRRGYPDVAVVIMTAHGTIRSAVRALREGNGVARGCVLVDESPGCALDRVLGCGLLRRRGAFGVCWLVSRRRGGRATTGQRQERHDEHDAKGTEGNAKGEGEGAQQGRPELRQNDEREALPGTGAQRARGEFQARV